MSNNVLYLWLKDTLFMTSLPSFISLNSEPSNLELCFYLSLFYYCACAVVQSTYYEKSHFRDYIVQALFVNFWKQVLAFVMFYIPYTTIIAMLLWLLNFVKPILSTFYNNLKVKMS